MNKIPKNQSPKDFLALQESEYYSSNGNNLRQGSIVYFPIFESTEDIRIFPPNTPIKLQKETYNKNLAEGEFDLYDYYWKSKQDLLPIPKWIPNNNGFFRYDKTTGSPTYLNGAVLMLTTGKLRPIIILSDLSIDKQDININNIVTVLPLISYKPDIYDPKRLDLTIIPPFQTEKSKQKYSYVCLNNAQSVNKKLLLGCKIQAQLSTEALELIIKKFIKLNFPNIEIV